MAAQDSPFPVDDVEYPAVRTGPPRKKRNQPALRLEPPVDKAVPVVLGSHPPRLRMSRTDHDDDDDAPDDDDDEAHNARPLAARARRRPRPENASTPPTSAPPSLRRAAGGRVLARTRNVAAGDRFAHLPLEIAGVVVFALSVLVLLSLLSYSSMDTAAGRGAPVQNWIGAGGAVLADLLTLVGGLAAFLAPAGLLVTSIACFRPVAQPRHALLRAAGGIAFVLGATTLLHVVFRGSSSLPFPAGGLVGAVLADAGSRALAPLGTSVIALAITFVGFLLALDRPVGPTTCGLAHKLVQLGRSALENLAAWREERRLVFEEEDRLRREMAAEHTAEEDATAAAQHSVPPSSPPALGTRATCAMLPADPPWTLSDVGPADEPIVDGKHVSLQTVLAGDVDEQADACDGDDGALRIIERKQVDAKAVVAAAEAVVEVSRQAFQLPPLNLLDYDAPAPEPLDEAKMRTQADKLIAKFKDFGIDGRIREIRPGPVVTTYEYVPAPGIKVSKIAALADDIAMAMSAIHVRIVAPIPGKGAIGIEIPNETRETVYMKEIIADEAFKKSNEKLMMALGKDIEGRSYYANLADMPHVLIAGTTGSGKSVSVNAMICSILYRSAPEDVRFLMIDPKMLELSIYEGIPHLLLPPIIDSKKAAVALKWAVGEMERRYQIMSELGVRDIAGFNARVRGALDMSDVQARKILTAALKGKPIEKLPFLVIVVDEYADLLAVAGKDVEVYIMRLAQKARAAGLHVMLATQRPSVDVITGVIKANFPVRMGFRLASNHDSKTIINRPGAEKLLGRGDMLFMPPGTSNVSRVHGAFISEKEIHRVVEFLKNQGKPTYDLSILIEPEGEEGAASEIHDEPKDARYDEAVAVVARTRKCSTSWLQRAMNLGYQRAARIVDRMEREGLVGVAQNPKGDREIHVKPDALPQPP